MGQSETAIPDQERHWSRHAAQYDDVFLDPFASGVVNPLWSALEAFVGEAVPGAKVGPLMCAGFTDSHWLREAFGTVAYGFFPASGEMPAEVAASLVHSADERIPVADLELGVRWLRHAAQSMLG